MSFILKIQECNVVFGITCNLYRDVIMGDMSGGGGMRYETKKNEQREYLRNG